MKNAGANIRRHLREDGKVYIPFKDPLLPRDRDCDYCASDDSSGDLNERESPHRERKCGHLQFGTQHDDGADSDDGDGDSVGEGSGSRGSSLLLGLLQEQSSELAALERSYLSDRKEMQQRHMAQIKRQLAAWNREQHQPP